MTNNNFYTVQAFMVKELELKGLDLNIFAIIYGFSQDGRSYFKGSINYLTEWTGATKKTIITSLQTLTNKGLLIKKKEGRNVIYKAKINKNEESSIGVKTTLNRCKNYTNIGEKITPNNIYDNIEIIYDKQINNNKIQYKGNEAKEKIKAEHTKEKLDKESLHPLTKVLAENNILSLFSDEETLQANNMLYNANLFFNFDRVKTSFFYTLNKVNKSKRVIQNKFRYFAKSFIKNLEKNNDNDWAVKLYNKEGTKEQNPHIHKKIDPKKYGLDL